MDSPSRFKNTLSFVDLLFNVLMGFVFLFIVAFLMINPVTKQGDVEVPGEYMIIMSWTDTSQDDVDLWVKNPGNKTVSFTARDVEGMSLDRDDLGSVSDTIVVNGKAEVIAINREVVTIRGIEPGIYNITAHMYRKVSVDPTDVTVEVIKLNPYRVVYKQTQTMTEDAQEKNFYQFTVNDSGDYQDITTASESAINMRSP